LAACAQAWRAARLGAAELDLDRVGIYLGAGEGELDFTAYTAAALSSWKPDSSIVDTVRWAEVAREMMNVTREVEPAAATPT
jgi:hypothetical protein